MASKLPSLTAMKEQAARQSAAPKTTATEEDAPAAAPGTLPAIDDARLQQVWNELKELRKAGSMSEYTVLNRPVQADERHVIRLRVDNPVQEDVFNDFRADFLGELRRRTGYPRLTVQVEVVEQQSTGRKLYTSADKFEYLAEKFPALVTMKQRLGLDTDF
ncbi:hypothetical protein LRS06_05595 [Hymenobacter sp. J193]|uniref:hypothetical protein n=1 Tax=Hymenobacter sp. J193 TaxID=2898429 RepID=UPI002150A5CA|nr:hypothetical protein [Hymenobacter sp. J193]MCR5887260.1 hypothetical protein [Hymenobacter sp. J193]